MTVILARRAREEAASKKIEISRKACLRVRRSGSRPHADGRRQRLSSIHPCRYGHVLADTFLRRGALLALRPARKHTMRSATCDIIHGAVTPR